jgi:hypothetical protein
VAPISWLLARDVRVGWEELNFSTWKQYDLKQQAKKRKESWEEIAEGEMPPWYYVIVHPEARLSAADRAVLRTWALESTGLASPSTAPVPPDHAQGKEEGR